MGEDRNLLKANFNTSIHRIILICILYNEYNAFRANNFQKRDYDDDDDIIAIYATRPVM